MPSPPFDPPDPSSVRGFIGTLTCTLACYRAFKMSEEEEEEEDEHEDDTSEEPSGCSAKEEESSEKRSSGLLGSGGEEYSEDYDTSRLDKLLTEESTGLLLCLGGCITGSG